MQAFIVELRYKKGPAFETRKYAESDLSAKAMAITEAIKRGFPSRYQQVSITCLRKPKAVHS